MCLGTSLVNHSCTDPVSLCLRSSGIPAGLYMVLGITVSLFPGCIMGIAFTLCIIDVFGYQSFKLSFEILWAFASALLWFSLRTPWYGFKITVSSSASGNGCFCPIPMQMDVDTSLLNDVVSEPVSLCLRSASIILLSSCAWLSCRTLSYSMQVNLLHRIRRCVDVGKVALQFRLGPIVGLVAVPKTGPYMVPFLAGKHRNLIVHWSQ